MLSTPKSKGELFLASSLRDGLEDNDLRQVKTLLLNKDADPNVLIPTHGISPFHLVIGNESETFAEEVTKLFLRHGGNPNVRSTDGMTPVHVAAAWGRVAVLELLLANGGDPLRLDDDCRTPFHYAFDGSYYNAIAVLGKYCGMNADEEKDDGPKYKLTLEKILINKGDCVAEYVPSETSSASSTMTYSSQNSLNPKEESSNSTNTTCGSMKKISTCTSDDSKESSSSLNTENVTLRRYHRFPKESSDERTVDEERRLVERIIDSLSSTHVSDSSTFDDDSTSRETIPKPKKIIRSYLPPPKYHSRNFKANDYATKLFPDNSIISKSPNIKIFVDEKTPIRSKINLSSPKSQNWTSKYRKNVIVTPSKTFERSDIVKKTISSTPKRKQFSVRSKIEKLRPVEKPIDDKRIYDEKYYRKNRFEEFSRSSDDETIVDDEDCKFKNIAVNLDDRMYDDNSNSDESVISRKCEKSNDDSTKNSTRRLRPPQIYNNFKKPVVTENTKSCNVDETKSNVNRSKNLLQSEKIVDKYSIEFPYNPEKMKNNEKEDTEKMETYFDSPGSKNAVSVTHLEYDNSLRRKIDGDVKNFDEDDGKIWLEIEEAWNERCGSPPASISFFDDDDSSDGTVDSPEIGGSTTFYSDCESEDTKTTEFYEAKMNYSDVLGNMRALNSRDSFTSVDEQYAYEDPEEGIAFIMRRLCVTPANQEDRKEPEKNSGSWVNRFDDYSLITSDNTASESSPTGPTKDLPDDKNLRERLTALGDHPGPITKTTFNVYLKRLWRLERERDKPQKSQEPSRKTSPLDTEKIATDRTIPDFLLTTDWTSKLEVYRNLEEQAFKEYAVANSNRKYRGGISKSSFCYLLLDPRITQDLPRTGIRLSDDDRWSKFLRGIFYVGQGKAARPAQHLYDAFGVWSGRRGFDNTSEKIKKILDIWNDKCGVVCLHVFSHTMAEEACSREAAMIGALGTSHLTNCVRGTYYGYTTTMNQQEKLLLGKYLLYKAMEIFMHEGERQLFPRNVLL